MYYRNGFILSLVGILLSTIFILGCSEKPATGSEDNENEWISTYEVAIEGNELVEVVGAELEDIASNINAQSHFDMSSGNKYNFVVADMQKEEFRSLVGGLGLHQKSDLLSYWSAALDCEIEEFQKQWKVMKSADENTYYSETPSQAIRKVFKYDNGKIYIKKVTKYITTSQDGEIVHKKAE